MAARSFHVIVKNLSGVTLKRKDMKLFHGEWGNSGKDVPPEQIPASTRAEWHSESDGLFTGTEGEVYYDSDKGSFKIVWNNPYSGSDYFGAWAPGGIDVNHSSPHGDDAVVTLVLTPSL